MIPYSILDGQRRSECVDQHGEKPTCTLDNLTAQGKVRPMIVVMLFG